MIGLCFAAFVTLTAPDRPDPVLSLPVEGLREGDRLGWVVAASPVAIVALSMRNAFIFERAEESWKQVANFALHDKGMTPLSAVISGDWCFVGATSSKSQPTASVLVYHRQNGSWTHDSTIAPPATASTGQFGAAVSAFGDRCLIGAPNENSNGEAAGAAYVFRLVDGKWTVHARLVPPDAAAHSSFGSFISMGSDRCVVSGWQVDEETRSRRPGGVHTFSLVGDEWKHNGRLSFRDEVIPSPMGFHPVCISGDRLAVGGARLGNDVCVVTYQWNGESWNQAAVARDQTGGGNTYGFGMAMALNESLLMVGPPLASYRFDQGQSLNHQLVEAGEASDSIPQSVGLIDSQWCIVGFPNSGRTVPGGGAILLMKLPPPAVAQPVSLADLSFEQLRERLEDVAAARREAMRTNPELAERLKQEFIAIMAEIRRRDGTKP